MNPINDLANDVRSIDGWHDMSARELAEKLFALGYVKRDINYEYGVRYGDDLTFRYAGTLEKARAKCDESFGDEVVRRLGRFEINHGEWEKYNDN